MMCFGPCSMPRNLSLTIDVATPKHIGQFSLRKVHGCWVGGTWLISLITLSVARCVFSQDKINYNEHVSPLIEANCSKCHNSDKKKADLDLTSYQGALKGSGSGVIVASGNVEGSKLWKSLTHAEEPFMPPNRPKLADKELEVFKQWILGGLLESAGAKAIAAVKPGLDLALKPEDLAKPEGPPPMPQELPLECVVHTARVGPLVGLAASPWAPVIAIAGRKQILLFNSNSREPAGILPFAEGEPVDVKFSRNGKLLIAAGGRGAKSGRVMVWDVVSGEHLMTLGKEYDSVLTADMRADQSMVALGGPDRLVKIYSTKTGELLHKIKKHTDWVTAVAFSPNGQALATADRNGGISLWDPESGQELFTLAGHKSGVTALSWRPDSKLLASASEDGTIKIWEVQEGKAVKSWAAHGSGVLCVSYSMDGQLVSCGRDNTVALWDPNGSKKRTFEFFGNLPLRAVFSNDSTKIIATDFEGRCAVWSTSDGKRVGELETNPLPLADQLARAKMGLNQLQSNVTNAAAVAQTNENAQGSALTAAREELTRLESAQMVAAAYKLRETLSAEKLQQQQLSEDIESKRRAVQESVKDVAAAKEAAAKADASLKSAKADIARDLPAAEKLAGQIQADKAQLKRLLDQIHPTNTPPQKLADKNGS
jgi:hypothetical protein